MYALASGVQSSSGSALSRAHHGRLTPWDMELHCCTRNDGSMQPRWHDDRLAVPTGAMPRLLVHLWAGGALDFMGIGESPRPLPWSSVVRPVRQAHKLLHGARGRAPRLDHYN